MLIFISIYVWTGMDWVRWCTNLGTAQVCNEAICLFAWSPTVIKQIVLVISTALPESILEINFRQGFLYRLFISSHLFGTLSTPDYMHPSASGLINLKRLCLGWIWPCCESILAAVYMIMLNSSFIGFGSLNLQLSWMRLYWSPTPKASYLLGSPSASQPSSLYFLSLFTFQANGPGICQYNLRQWIQQLSGTLTPEKNLDLSKSSESGTVKKSQDAITGATKVGAQTNWTEPVSMILNNDIKFWCLVAMISMGLLLDIIQFSYQWLLLVPVAEVWRAITQGISSLPTRFLWLPGMGTDQSMGSCGCFSRPSKNYTSVGANFPVGLP